MISLFLFRVSCATEHYSEQYSSSLVSASAEWIKRLIFKVFGEILCRFDSQIRQICCEYCCIPSFQHERFETWVPTIIKALPGLRTWTYWPSPARSAACEPSGQMVMESRRRFATCPVPGNRKSPPNRAKQPKHSSQPNQNHNEAHPTRSSKHF